LIGSKNITESYDQISEFWLKKIYLLLIICFIVPFFAYSVFPIYFSWYYCLPNLEANRALYSDIFPHQFYHSRKQFVKINVKNVWKKQTFWKVKNKYKNKSFFIHDMYIWKEKGIKIQKIYRSCPKELGKKK
jgi:hypothetical protein